MGSFFVDWTCSKRGLEKSDGAPRKGAIYKAPGMAFRLVLLCIIKMYVGYCRKIKVTFENNRFVTYNWKSFLIGC